MSEPRLAAGNVVAATYCILRRVATGGMGEIYEATHRRLAGRYAIKLLRPEVAATPDALERFEREAKVTSALRHPNIVQVIDFSTLEGGDPFLVMEFLDGLELFQIMKRSGPLPLARTASLVKQIAAGLTAAHERHVIHRDLKPQNVFVLEVAGHEQELVKIVDFGISKVKDLTSHITQTSTVMGTVQYMSPEQARGRIDDIDARTDQFALAAIVYEMLTGEEAFRGADATSILYQIVHEEPRRLDERNGPIPPPVAAVLRRALSKDKERRFSSVRAISLAHEAAAAAGTVPLANTVASKPAKRDEDDEATRTVGGGASSRRLSVFGLGVAAFVVGGVWMARREPPRRDASHQPAASAALPRPLPAPVPAASPPAIVVPPPAPLRPVASDKHPARRHAAAQADRDVVRASPSPPTQPDCNPNYVLDMNGDKHFKRECFVQSEAAAR
jgi:serine/threonine-protein kinase